MRRIALNELWNATLDQRNGALERRSIGRTKIAKGALLFFAEQAGAFSCTVRDVTNRGAGVRF